MLQAIQNYLRRRQRTKIYRKLNGVYADMREVTECAQILKRLAESQEAHALAALAKKEQHLIAKAKALDMQETFCAIPTRSARAW